MKRVETQPERVVKVPTPGKRTKTEMVKVAVKTTLVALGISVAYFGVIAILMSPAFDVVRPA